MTASLLEQQYAAPAALPAHETPVSGAAVLDEVRGFLKRFCVFPDDASADAAALWCAHTWGYEAFDCTPRLAIQSAEPGSGKTRLLDLLATLVPRPEAVVAATGATVFALIRECKPVLLVDETDNGGVSGRQILSILNVGYRRGAQVPRMRAGRVERFGVFAPAAFAGLGKLPETLQSRCVQVQMRKRRSGESCDAFYPRMHAPLGQAIGASLGAWVASVLPELGSAWPVLPDGVEDRAAEIWGPLLAIGEVAGGHWALTARRACEELVLGGGADSEPVKSPGLQLLEDIERVWPADAAKLPTAELVRLLMDVPGNTRNWDPASAPRELAAMLRPHGIEPTKVRLGERTAQGYLASAFPALRHRETAAA